MKEPKFERRHMNAVAEVVRVVGNVCDRGPCWQMMKAELADMFARDNPRFKRGKFEEACEP